MSDSTTPTAPPDTSAGAGSAHRKLTIEEILTILTDFYMEATRRYLAEQDRIAKEPNAPRDGRAVARTLHADVETEVK